MVNQPKPGVFAYSGRSIHLSKESPFQPIFQKVRREFVLRVLSDGTVPESLHFSAAFAASTKGLKELRNKFLKIIEETNSEIEKSSAEELALLVIDFTKI